MCVGVCVCMVCVHVCVWVGVCVGQIQQVAYLGVSGTVSSLLCACVCVCVGVGVSMCVWCVGVCGCIQCTLMSSCEHL